MGKQFERLLSTRIPASPILFRCTMSLIVVMTAVASTKGENWPRLRGPAGVGVTGETNLPLTWNGKSGEGVLWKASLKGTTGHSSPIVWRDRVFLTLANKQTKEQEQAKEIPDHHVACFNVVAG